MGRALDLWAAELAGWAIPEAILDAAPESPWGFPVQLFEAVDQAPPDTPSTRRALECLQTAPAPGLVLDVGAGGGRASLPLCPPAAGVVGVDQGPDLLAAFGAEATRRGIGHRSILGSWPEVADSTPVADLVVCHHVVYNVADLGPFVRALTTHARDRVVVELTATHPLILLGPLWLRFHGLARPSGPDADDLVAVLEELGLRPGMERFIRPPSTPGLSRADIVALTRRRLCLPAARDAEIDDALGPDPLLFPSEATCVWWEGEAPPG